MTTFADIQIQQATPTNKCLEEMNATLPWQRFESILIPIRTLNSVFSKNSCPCKD